jgi:REP element-mobilizing transposase RayT
MPQSLGLIYLHVVFSTKNRHAMLRDEWRQELFRVLGAEVNKTGCQSILAGGVADHVHMLFQLGRSVTLAQVVGAVKTNSCHWINRTQHPLQRFSWQGGYAAFSIDHSAVAATAEYISNQEAHHQQQSFADELRDIFRRAGIEWDERYVWD